MGVLKQGILGGFSGKVGNVIGGSWKGIATIRVMPISVANPQTAAQVAQRTKFTNVVEVAVILLANIIKPLWDRFASQMSGFNDFVAHNISLFATDTPSVVAEFKIARGKMAATAIDDAVSADGTANVVFTWTDDTGSGYKLTDDEAYAVVYNVNSKLWGFSAAITDRDTETITVIMSAANTVGDALHCYLAFRRADGTVASNTSYKSETTPGA